MSTLKNSISEIIKEKHTWIEYSIIVAVESFLAIIVIQNMFKLLISTIS